MIKEYEEILQQYPEEITLEQLYKICHISKRKASWLLKNGIIPCKDSGKKTRRFKIKTIDVINYMENQSGGQGSTVMPIGIFSSIKKPKKAERIEIDKIKKIIAEKFMMVKDVLTISEAEEVMQMTGITRLIQQKKLNAYWYKNKYVITKEDLQESYFKMLLSNGNYYKNFHSEIMEEYKNSNQDVIEEDIQMNFGGY